MRLEFEGNWVAIISCLKKKKHCREFCVTSCNRSTTARLAPQLQISSQHFAQLPVGVKMFHWQYYLEATVIRTVSKQTDVYAYIHTLFTV
jgi:hypothetical protein